MPVPAPLDFGIERENIKYHNRLTGIGHRSTITICRSIFFSSVNTIESLSVSFICKFMLNNICRFRSQLVPNMNTLFLSFSQKWHRQTTKLTGERDREGEKVGDRKKLHIFYAIFCCRCLWHPWWARTNGKLLYYNYYYILCYEICRARKLTYDIMWGRAAAAVTLSLVIK